MKIPNDTVRNTVKNLILLFLVVLLVVLVPANWLNDLNISMISADSVLGKLYIDLSYGEAGGFALRTGEIAAAQPVECAVGGPDAMIGVQYDETAIRSYLSAYGKDLGDALGMVKTWTAAGEEALEQALTQPCLVVRYANALPVSLITDWLGSVYQASTDPQADTLLLCADGTLWLRGQELYQAHTSQMPEDWPNAEEAPGGQACGLAAWNARVPDTSGVHAETILFEQENFSLPVLSVHTPNVYDANDSTNVSSLLQAFEYESFVRSYEENGAVRSHVYVENLSTLRISENGQVEFTANTLNGGLEAYLETEVGTEDPLAYQVDYARRVVEMAMQAMETDANVFLSRVYRDETAKVTQLMFRYAVNGVPVTGEEGIMAVLEFQRNRLTSATLSLRSFRIQDTQQYVLPGLQAAGAAGETPCRLCVGYFVTDETECVPRRYYLSD